MYIYICANIHEYAQCVYVYMYVCMCIYYGDKNDAIHHPACMYVYVYGHVYMYIRG